VLRWCTTSIEVHVTRLDSRLIAVALCATAGCVAQASLGPRLGPPPPPAEGTVATGGAVDAGCSYNATQIPRELGETVQVHCPADCPANGSLWGTEVYTADSSICLAAVHAGALPQGGGVVTVHREYGHPAYRGSIRNGVQSSDYGSYDTSYRFVGAVIAAEPPPAGPEIIEVGCTFNATELHGGLGSSHRIACPANCGATGSTWGSDVYTADSTICRAAIHAGLITEHGGEVTVVLEPGRPAYRGSRRHGVESSDYGSFGASYRFAR
jgi:hypothetical protein